jgi:spore germination protein KC
MTRCDRKRPTKLLGLALSVILALSLGGCYSRREIELTGFILAVGLDRGEELPLRLVAQLAVPAAVAGERDGGGDQPSVLLSAEGNTISEAIQELSMVTPDRLFWGHADIVIFTVEAIEGGLGRVVDIVLREREFRPAARIYVTEEDLDELLSVEFPTQPMNASYIERLSERSTSYSMSLLATVKDLGCASVSSECALLVPVLKLDQSSLAGMQNGDGKSLRLEGSAIISSAGLLGQLNGTETRGALWALGRAGETSVSLVRPADITGFVGVRVLRSWSEVTVHVNQEQVEDSIVKIVVRGEADLTEIQDDQPYQDVEDLTSINAALNDAIMSETRAALTKAQTMAADVFGLAERFRQSMAAKQWRDVRGRWPAVFQQLRIDVQADFSVRRRGMRT